MTNQESPDEEVVTKQSIALDEAHNVILFLKETHLYDERDALIISMRVIESALRAEQQEQEPSDFLHRLRQLNKERCEQNFKHSITSWNIMEWGCALAGEAGELCNVLKKIQRERDGIAGSRIDGDSTKAIADELADVIIYGDLLAELCGIDIAEAVANKFNETSAKVDYKQTLTASPPATPTQDTVDAKQDKDRYEIPAFLRKNND